MRHRVHALRMRRPPQRIGAVNRQLRDAYISCSRVSSARLRARAASSSKRRTAISLEIGLRRPAGLLGAGMEFSLIIWVVCGVGGCLTACRS